MRTTILLTLLAICSGSAAEASAATMNDRQLDELNRSVADLSLAAPVATQLAQHHGHYNKQYRGHGHGRAVYTTGYRGYGGGYGHPCQGGSHRYQYNYYRGRPYRGGYPYPYPYGYGYGGYGPYGYPAGYGGGSFGLYIGF